MWYKFCKVLVEHLGIFNKYTMWAHKLNKLHYTCWRTILSAINVIILFNKGCTTFLIYDTKMSAWWTETRFQQTSSFELSAIMRMKWPVSNYQIVLCGAKRYIVISISLLCLMLSLLVDWPSLPTTTGRINNHHHHWTSKRVLLY